MRDWNPERIARAAGARLCSSRAVDSGPERAVIDSREAGPGALFVGLRGQRADGGEFAGPALAAGAWGILAAPEHAEAAAGQAGGVVLAADDPLRALQRLASAWRHELGAKVVGVTGSTGKTSTKDLLHAVLAPHRRTVASRANFNTEIGLPLEILAAPAGTEVLVLEMAMRGAGQIAELAAIAEPDVGVIVSVGPVHLELLGTIEAVAAAKAELLAGLRPGSTAIVPAGERLLEPHLRADLETITFGDGGDVRLLRVDGDRLQIDLAGRPIELEVSFQQAHLRRNLLAAAAAARAIGVVPEGRVQLQLTAGRGERTRLPGDVTLIDDCYNANPMSMRAALEDLSATDEREPHARRVAVLGDMLELGPDEREFHAAVGEHASAAGVDVLVTVGPRAAAMSERFTGAVRSAGDAAEAAELVPSLLRAGDLVLVKGSRGVGLELVCRALRNGAGD
ncbi:MAG TPA: UDP-N-acetylmuramoyl-tripeptide--D-alanyl-D-alanine ligase [Solirubrobacteraceae bacterium]|nr:UDP-N-acetylmuramoyl-tripeptide--D-alanyl-D-alanine ligase [Solirubrobacteraceae bacterium]